MATQPVTPASPPPPSRDDLERYRANLRDEVDGAELYRQLAGAAKEERLRRIYTKLAASEEKHQALWRRKLEEAGVTVPEYKPSFRVKVIGWLARRFGVESVSPLVARMEQTAFTMYDDQPEALEAGLPSDERGHAVISREIARSGIRANEIANIEGRHRGGSGNALRAAVLGANDGLVSNLSLVMGIAGADPGRDIVLLAGLGGLLAGSLSMAQGEWISVKSSREAFDRQVQIERDELLFIPEEEEEELALIYEAKGLRTDEARALAKRIIADPEVALDTLTREELGMSEEEAGSPMVAAITSFLTFGSGALLPILPWLVGGGNMALLFSALFGALGLFLTGAMTSLFTGLKVTYSGGRMMVMGLAMAGITFALGKVIGVSTGI